MTSQDGPPPPGPNPYGYNPYGSNPYGPNPYATHPYALNPYGIDPYGMGRTTRPANVTPSIALGCTCAGLLLTGMLFIWAGTTLIVGVDPSAHRNSSIAMGVLLSLGNLIAAGLLIGGSVGLANRSVAGRITYTAGAVIVFALGIVWLAKWTAELGGFVILSLLFIGLAGTGAVLSWSPSVTGWLRPGDADHPTQTGSLNR